MTPTLETTWRVLIRTLAMDLARKSRDPGADAKTTVEAARQSLRLVEAQAQVEAARARSEE